MAPGRERARIIARKQSALLLIDRHRIGAIQTFGFVDDCLDPAPRYPPVGSNTAIEGASTAFASTFYQSHFLHVHSMARARRILSLEVERAQMTCITYSCRSDLPGLSLVFLNRPDTHSRQRQWSERAGCSHHKLKVNERLKSPISQAEFHAIPVRVMLTTNFIA
jgi:hypothetical protein